VLDAVAKKAPSAAASLVADLEASGSTVPVEALMIDA